MDEFIPGVFLGFTLGIILMAAAFSHTENTLANRSLSCMAAGNTVAQCQDILGITK